MQKIIIKNFRAIEYAEIELKKVLVLIGAQASGKSTIAKLIYFFKTIQDDFFVQVYESGNTDLEKLVRRKFIEFFGLVKDDFEVEFLFDLDGNKYIKIRKIGNDTVITSNKIIIDEVENRIKELYKKLKGLKKEEAKVLDFETLDINKEDFLLAAERSLIYDKLSEIVVFMFSESQNDKLYTIAGRSATVTYSKIFNNIFSIQSNLKKENKINSISTDEQLMLSFIKRIDWLKSVFRNYDGSFKSLFEQYWDGNIEEWKKNYTTYSDIYLKKISKILKGKYLISDNGEQLILENGKSIHFSDASSGQQEVIRILQDLFVVLLTEKRFLRIIEEPEAHLFPIAQKELIELLALAVNYQPENQLIIATHSPYILTVFNNLLFANRVVEKNPDARTEVEAIVEADFWLNPKDFAAYSLGSDVDDKLYCRSIVNEKTGMIQQNYLDEVSEILGARFNALFAIYKKSFKSRRR